MDIYNNLIDKENKDNNMPAFEIKWILVNNSYTNIFGNKKPNLYYYEDYYNIKYFTQELMFIKNKKIWKKYKY